MEDAFMRRAFWVLNKFLMIPMIRLGLLPLMGTPLGGWIMLLTTTGRKTGKRRFTPVNYALVNGNVYCLAGFGHAAHWYRRYQAAPPPKKGQRHTVWYRMRMLVTRLWENWSRLTLDQRREGLNGTNNASEASSAGGSRNAIAPCAATSDDTHSA